MRYSYKVQYNARHTENAWEMLDVVVIIITVVFIKQIRLPRKEHVD